MSPKGNYFEIDRAKAQTYFYWRAVSIVIIFGLCIYFFGVFLALIYAVTLGHYIAYKQAQAIKYWLEGGNLRIEHGFLFRNRKSIPLDRVTDFVLAQGPLMRIFDIWQLKIQTAGAPYPEGILYSLKKPEEIREHLIKKRDEVVKKSTG